MAPTQPTTNNQQQLDRLGAKRRRVALYVQRFQHDRGEQLEGEYRHHDRPSERDHEQHPLAVPRVHQVAQCDLLFYCSRGMLTVENERQSARAC